jgi:hypothetical protein
MIYLDFIKAAKIAIAETLRQQMRKLCGNKLG